MGIDFDAEERREKRTRKRLSSVQSNELLDPDEIRRDERKRVWKEISKHIRPGILPGNGRDKQAERNGLILATNIIFDLGI